MRINGFQIASVPEMSPAYIIAFGLAFVFYRKNKKTS